MLGSNAPLSPHIALQGADLGTLETQGLPARNRWCVIEGTARDISCWVGRIWYLKRNAPLELTGEWTALAAFYRLWQRAASSLGVLFTPADLSDVPKSLQQKFLIHQHCPLDCRIGGHRMSALGSSLPQTAALSLWGVGGCS